MRVVEMAPLGPRFVGDCDGGGEGCLQSRGGTRVWGPICRAGSASL